MLNSLLLPITHLVELLEAEGAEAVVPDLMDFMFYCFYNQLYKADNLGTSKKSAKISKMGIKIIERLRKPAAEAFAKSKHFIPPADIEETARNASADRISLVIRLVKAGS